ncbi:type I-E CRISPR-associated protein Cse1/CasA [Kitasatospora sp. NPDC051984]|uniref:type I-E CRISPR-associated protein Cse1/CasA n=1 Tax=Kitasatospora sp. NPDC051984 TaxID=3364059 RepID=UPI0037C7049E
MSNEFEARPFCGIDILLWGKEDGLDKAYPLICHLLDTAAVAGAVWDAVLGAPLRVRLAEELGVEEAEARRLVMVWAGLHDMGKISPSFQALVEEEFAKLASDPRYAEASSPASVRHEAATHWGLVELLQGWGYPAEGRRVRSWPAHQVAQLLGGHHGCFERALQRKELDHPSAYLPGLGTAERWAEQRAAHAEVVRGIVGGGAVPVVGLSGWAAVVVLGLVVVADWLVSQVEVIEGRIPVEGWVADEGALRAHFDVAVSGAKGWVAEAGLGQAVFPARAIEEMFDFEKANPLQQSLARELPALVSGPGLVLVTAPTGDGKSEAALFAASVLARASGAGGLYFALPTMATADAMFGRVRDFADRNLEGDRGLMPVHGMARLSPLFKPAQGSREGEEEVRESRGISSQEGTSTEAAQWLWAGRRGLLAPLAVGTVDQALTGVLPVRYGFLRLFGLANKVVVVDEAHAYGPWMHSLLVRLLEWLGALGAPVVLLSATLTGRAASSLVEAYRRGAGFEDRAVVEPCYPGWLFVDAATGRVSEPRAVESDRARELVVERRPVRWDVHEDGAPAAGSRRAALVELVAPVVDGGGCVLVCCTTVEEAQRTLLFLREEFPGLVGRAGGLRLLHSRFPALVRERISGECEEAFGKGSGGGVRAGSVLVATQVVEQSLDLDFDLVVSDLAPLAQLLQRAGRGWRHKRGERPGWAGGKLRLVVLEPVGDHGGVRVPGSWGSVYDASLLVRTSTLLAGLGGRAVAVPGDVQGLVDAVYEEDFGRRLEESARREFERWDVRREAGELAEAQLAELVRIPAPGDVDGDWSVLTDAPEGVSEELLATRLGAETARVVFVYARSGGGVSLDREGRLRVPGWSRGRGVGRADAVEVLRHSVPLPAGWVAGESEGDRLVGPWARTAMLKDLRVVVLREDREGRWIGRVGGQELQLSDVGVTRGWTVDEPLRRAAATLPRMAAVAAPRTAGERPQAAAAAASRDGAAGPEAQEERAASRREPVVGEKKRKERAVTVPEAPAVFNLVDEPWIPVRWLAGLPPLAEGGERPAAVGLRRLLVDAHEIEEIAVGLPPALAGLYRVLAAITARVTGLDERGPGLWGVRRERVQDGGRFDVEAVGAYLDRYWHRFDVFDEVRPFLQDPRLAQQCDASNTAGVDKLVTTRPSGNNHAWFEHVAAGAPVLPETAEAVLHLLVWQYFGASGRCSSRTVGAVKAADAKAGPLRSTLSYHPQGASLFETLLANLVEPGGQVRREEDLCPWEQAELNDPLGVPARVQGPCSSLTGRSQHALLLVPDGDGRRVRDAFITWAWREKVAREGDPYLIWQLSKEGNSYPRPADSGRALWRDVDALLLSELPGESRPRRPEVFRTAPEVSEWLRVRALGFEQDGQAKDVQFVDASTPPVLGLSERRAPDSAALVSKLRAVGEMYGRRLELAVKKAWQQFTDAPKLKDCAWAVDAGARYWPAAEAEFWDRFGRRDFEGAGVVFRRLAEEAFEAVTARAVVSVRGARACEAARIELYGGRRKSIPAPAVGGSARRGASKEVAR